MTEVLITIAIILVIIMILLLLLLIRSNLTGSREIAGQSISIGLLQQQLEAIRTGQDKYSQTLEKDLHSGQQEIGKVLQTSQQTLNSLHSQLGELKGSSSRILELGTDVRTLRDILNSPKLRGQMGEQSLEKVLTEILPAESFELQHTFKNGRVVDALVDMRDYRVPIDAKFPLPSFEAMLKADNDDEKNRLRRQFQNDVIKHIDKIACDYIRPDEQTLDFALMYIPAENVYYETIIKYDSDKTDIMNYALGKKVIPVSPNLLYAYLMTIVMGLRGLQIEKQAVRIRRDLGKITNGFADFISNWDVLGRHLRNAQSQYEEGRAKLNKFESDMAQIQSDPEADKSD